MSLSRTLWKFEKTGLDKIFEKTGLLLDATIFGFQLGDPLKKPDFFLEGGYLALMTSCLGYPEL